MRITAGEKSIPGGRATGGRGMGIGEAKSLLGHAIDIRSFEEAFGPVTGRLPITHVIEKDEKDIGAVGC